MLINSQLILTTLAAMSIEDGADINVDKLTDEHKVREDDKIQVKAAMRNEIVRQRMLVSVDSIVNAVKKDDISLSELYAAANWSTAKNQHSVAQTRELSNKKDYKKYGTACHVNCHQNCHGSRSWR